MDLEGKICKLAARAAAVSPALVRKAVGALERSSAARAAADVLIYQFLSTVFMFFATGFLNLVAVEACSGKNCTVASILFLNSAAAAVLCSVLLLALFYIGAAVALWRMNPQQRSITGMLRMSHRLGIGKLAE